MRGESVVTESNEAAYPYSGKLSPAPTSHASSLTPPPPSPPPTSLSRLPPRTPQTPHHPQEDTSPDFKAQRRPKEQVLKGRKGKRQSKFYTRLTTPFQTASEVQEEQAAGKRDNTRAIFERMVAGKRRRSVFDTSMQAGLTVTDFTEAGMEDKEIIKFFGVKQETRQDRNKDRTRAKLTEVFDAMSRYSGGGAPTRTSTSASSGGGDDDGGDDASDGVVSWPLFAAFCAGQKAFGTADGRGGGKGGVGGTASKGEIER